MPISADIYAGFKPQPMATLGEIAESRQRREINNINISEKKRSIQAEQEKAEKAAKKQQLIHAAVQKYTRPDGVLDQEGLVSEVTAQDYEAGQEISKSLTALRKEAGAARKAELENEDAIAKQLAQWLQGVQDESTYQPVLARVKAIDPEAAEFLGPQFDPNRVSQMVNAGTERTAYNAQYKEILANQDKDEKKALELLAIAKDPEHWQDAIEFAQLHGVDKQIAAMGFTPEFTPDGPQRANELALGALERAKQENGGSSGGSDYGRFEQDFLESEASKLGKTADQLSPTERVKVKTLARKVYGQADDRPTGAAGGMSPYAEANVLNRLVNQWQTASRPAVELNRQVKLMDAGLDAARRGDLAQGAQAILVTFQKILDPTSVVRESEYMRSAAGQSLDNRVSGYIEQLSKGGAGIPVVELEKFARLARDAAKAQATGYVDSVKARIGRSADHFSIPRDLVFEDFNLESGQSTAPGSTTTQPSGVPDQVKTLLGSQKPGIYTLSNGKSYRKSADGSVSEAK